MLEIPYLEGKLVKSVLEALFKVHSYKEPAYHLIKVCSLGDFSLNTSEEDTQRI